MMYLARLSTEFAGVLEMVNDDCASRTPTGWIYSQARCDEKRESQGMKAIFATMRIAFERRKAKIRLCVTSEVESRE